MTVFDLLTNYIENPEALLRRTKAKLKKVSALESEDNQTKRSLTLVFEAMAHKTLHEFSTPTTANFCTGPAINIGNNAFELKLALINMVQLASFVEKHMKMRVLISNTSWRFAALSPSKELLEMPYYFASSHSHFWGRRSNSSTPTKI
jgi:hypothetical protein